MTGVRISTRSSLETALRVDLMGLRSTCSMVDELMVNGAWWLKMTGVWRWAFHDACSLSDMSIGGLEGPQQ